MDLIKIILVIILGNSQLMAQVWQPDNGNGNFTNPVLYADYSDPDAIRVGDDYYMISSSFNHVPGLPILHSKDLVNWELIGHALNRITPVDHFKKVQHGGGVWAPAIRFHNNKFYIYYPDPDFGIYMIQSSSINGPWSDPNLVEEGKGLIDPCPLWDNDGKVYLVHAYAGSRAGFKSIIVVKEMNKEGTKTISDPVMVYDGHVTDPTIEGPKFYKRNNYYYIFAPAGGVSTGWQLVLRSKNIYGPYERKVVMDQGKSTINGPHQGAWVDTKSREDWFLHFQDKEAYGRVVHLQPMKWINDWPVIGNDADGDGKGEPVTVFKKPNAGKTYPFLNPATSDEFNTPVLGLQWQWQANPSNDWAFPTSNGNLRMFSVYQSDSNKNIWSLPNILAQKFPAENFKATVQFRFFPKFKNEKFGFVVFGTDYAYLSVEKTENGLEVVGKEKKNADKGGEETEFFRFKTGDYDLFFTINVTKGGVCSFSFSENAKNNRPEITHRFIAKPGRWVGAKLGFFCTRDNVTNDAGYVDINWIQFTPITNQ